MSQLQRLIKKPARASRGAVKSAAATAALLQTSCDLTDIKETDGCMHSCSCSSIIPLYTEEEEEVVCLRWQGWLKVFNPLGPLNPTLYTPTTTLCADCPRHDSRRWSFCSSIDYGTPLLHLLLKGPSGTKNAVRGSSREAVVAKVWLYQNWPWWWYTCLRMADWQQAYFLHRGKMTCTQLWRQLWWYAVHFAKSFNLGVTAATIRSSTARASAYGHVCSSVRARVCATDWGLPPV